MTIFDDYIARCRSLIVALQGILPLADLQLATHLIDHGEAPEGIRALAWAIVDGNVLVAAEVVAQIREYADDIIDKSDMPENLESFILVP